MNVPKLPFLEKRKSEYFLSLVLRDDKASAVIFKEVGGRVNVVGEHNEPFKATLDDTSEEELLNVLDRAVSIAEKNLPEGEESQKTIFGVKQDWVIDGKIKPEYLTKLKKVSDELQFKPVGFLVITEAIAHLLQNEEGAPVSAILTEIGKKNITVSIIKAGKVLETKSAHIEGNIPTLVDSLLKHFTVAEVLPFRIIIFDSGSEKLQQAFISHKWSKELGFLHDPQVTNLPSNYDARAVLNGAASQMGYEVLAASLVKAEREDAKEIDALDEAVTDDGDITLGEAVSEFGFSEEDVAVKPKTAVDESVGPGVKTDNITISDQFKEIPEESKIENSDKRALGVDAAALGVSMKVFLEKLKLGKIFKGGSRKKLLFIAVPLVLLVLLFGFYFFGRSATVTLGVKSENTDKTEAITFSEDSETNAADNIINAKFITVDRDGKVSIPATGKKETGDKARGTVTIFNSGSIGKTIPTGTVLVSSTDLKFVTDKAVTVASASGDIFSGTEPGKADVTVTAEKFGTNYNLPSDTKFSVGSDSQVAAKNDKAFTGGTKKDVKVVSQKDLDKLTKDMMEKLESEAKSEISDKAEEGWVILPDLVSSEFGRKSFSKKVDEEANEVSLTATVTFRAVSYKKSDLVEFAKDKLSEEIPPNMMIDPERITANATDLTQKNGQTSGKVKISAAIVPKIDSEKIAREIAGSSVRSATKDLQSIPEVEKVNIEVFVNLPLLPQRLPFSSKKIKVVVDKNG